MVCYDGARGLTEKPKSTTNDRWNDLMNEKIFTNAYYVPGTFLDPGHTA